jgi:two-component system LytT family response regulator
MVIFTTAFESYAIKAFEANATDYLLKPFSKERFDKAIQRTLQQYQHPVAAVAAMAVDYAASSQRIVVKDNGKIKIIPVDEVRYLEASDDYVKVITAEGNFLKKKTMQFFEQSLPPQEFVRIHRGYIVNTQLIARIDVQDKDSYTVLLTTGNRLPVSRQGYVKLKQVLGI